MEIYMACARRWARRVDEVDEDWKDAFDAFLSTDCAAAVISCSMTAYWYWYAAVRDSDDAGGFYYNVLQYCIVVSEPYCYTIHRWVYHNYFEVLQFGSTIIVLYLYW